MKYLKSINVLLVLLFIQAISQNIYPQEPNSAKDPILKDYSTMESASSPLPYGIILNFAYPLTMQANSDNHSDASKLLFGIDAYYECWQIGFHRRLVGDLVMIQPRTYGRDAFSTVFLAVGGSDIIKKKFEKDNNGTVLLIGLKNILGFSNRPRFSFLVNGYLGAVIPDGSTITVAGIDLGIGLRIPINSSALTVQLQYGMLLMGADYAGLENLLGYGSFAIPINLGVSYAFNFNK